MPKIVHFELPFDDAERANRFYAEVFGWESHRWEGPHEYYLQQTGAEGEPGIHGALAPRERMASGGGTHIVIGVDDLDAYVAKVTAAGCDIVTPRTAIPGVGWFADFRDTEGNVMGMFQRDDGAASPE